MSLGIAALISFVSIMILASHMSPQARRRLVGYCGWVDLCLHGTIIWLFVGTSTLGLMQAEASAILISITLRAYRWSKGYERIKNGKWTRYAGAWT